MQVNLERFCYSPQGTFGRLHLPDVSLYTVEKPWVWSPQTPAGVPFQSCVPEGDYKVFRTSTPDHLQTFILESHENWVFQTKQDDVSRYGILIHIANTMLDVVGCIGPGLRLGCLIKNGQYRWAVLDSADAFEIVWNLPVDNFDLRITQIQGADSGGPSELANR